MPTYFRADPKAENLLETGEFVFTWLFFELFLGAMAVGVMAAIDRPEMQNPV